MDYQQAMENLRLAHNEESAKNRDLIEKEDWKIAERLYFLDLLRRESRQTLLEVGAGTGIDGLFFQSSRLCVICTDLSPAMVSRYREKGLEAYVMDFLHPSFDALYALSCLLHVPTGDLPAVLRRLRDILRPGGLFFLGVYGRLEEEGGVRRRSAYPLAFLRSSYRRFYAGDHRTVL